MSNFQFKEPKRKITHPNDDPARKETLRKAEARVKSGALNFESEGARKDYERAINANPNNVYGMPEFFPPEVLKSKGFGEGKKADTLPCGHTWSRIKYVQDKKVAVKVYQCRQGHAYTETEQGYAEYE